MPFFLLVVTVALAIPWPTSCKDRLTLDERPTQGADLEVVAARCGFGGVGPSMPGGEPMYVSLELDLHARGTDDIVALDVLELIDAGGLRVAGANAPTLRVAGEAVPDAWPPGTVVWDGRLGPGERRTVRAFGQLDRRWKRLPTGPFRCRATLVHRGDVRLPVLTGEAWAWPTG
jgi:hypothetical protein